MRQPRLPSALVFVVTLTWSPAVLLAQDPTRVEPPPPAPVASVEAPGAAAFPGLWDYNAPDSLIAGTTRPEQSPRGANVPRRGLGAGLAGAGTTGRGGGGGLGRGGGGGGGVGGGGTGRARVVSPFVTDARDVPRDLLEVPETLTIAVAPDGVTFTDDLGRVQVFPTDGRKHRRQIGAARFEVQARWVGNQLHKTIETAVGFKMTQAYFLSADGQRLFVIIRVGEPKPDEPVVGVNRVYDRVPQGGQ